jgi:DNA-binding LacI/PurR family transcriptional regulator
MTARSTAGNSGGERRPHRVNMADVATAAGVSTSTVSRALRNMPGVSEEQRSRIREIANELSYVISPEASRLSRGDTGRVAVVVPVINHWYFSTVLAGVEAVMREAGLDVLVYQIGEGSDRRRFFHDLPARRKADAVIMIALPLPAGEASRLELLGVQVVVAGGRLLDYPHVCVDDLEIGRRAVTHLADLGHRDIAMIRTYDHEGVLWPADLARAQGYRAALADHGRAYDRRLVVTTQFGFQGGRQAALKLLALDRPPTAIFAHADEVAFGVLRALDDAGVEVPGEMSVIGVDDHPLSELHGLTTVRQPVEELGRVAARMVLDQLAGRPLREPAVCLPTELVVRASTAPPEARRPVDATRHPNRTGVRSSDPAGAQDGVASPRTHADRSER